MFSKKTALAAFAGTALLLTSGAFANDGNRWGHGNGYRASVKHGHAYYPQRHYRYAPRRVVVIRPAPRHYYVPPRPAVVYGVPAPVVYAHVPVGPDLRVSFGLHF